MKILFDIENVSKSYLLGKIEVLVLKDINLTINKGEFAAIMGPSGKIVIADMDISKLSEIELAYNCDRIIRLKDGKIENGE
ncbi:MAG TPA: hypothetical protein VF354_04585 [Candidatus Methanoperedens sp.]